MSKILIEHSEYDREFSREYVKTIIKGKTIRSCLLQAFDVLGLYEDTDSVLEQEEENGKKFTDEELTEKLNEAQGDGCDYIYKITDLETGKALYEGDPYQEEVDEYESEYDNI